MGPAERLKQISDMAGFETVSDLARAVGIEPGTARQHFNRDSIPKNAADRYVRKAGQRGVVTTLEWLLHGRGRAPVKLGDVEAPPTPALRQRLAPALQDDVVTLNELDVQAASGPGTNWQAMADDPDAVKGQWSLPRATYLQQFSASPEGVEIIMVIGDSMTPTLHPGQRVAVDTRDRKPSPPGLFVVWDGLGLVVKRVEPVPGSNPVAVRIMSDNKLYSSYERTLDEAHINGRVVGTWSRT
jgi:hypothetical protein